ncbi:glycerol-3-phosphate dehydrogenase/oxidase [Micromonospora endophytica]|uniref:Glycerol-3-phosphate dehydrogenase n=1 Tax=Micromonospora endophytica TaxID=515350 RepID=A0A2W2BW28_9ACTN|nr:glycerol-3-phosphate dehydrogenase/oxidase [Micromonospora endophytica]PZF90282.1 FAD-dependent oxidoreductase [Micromonospora endophytica]RIW48749.1 glycerol-3-phosphate dehydrogenase/oxidase [Micromonospora endophytica]BCJ59961.1 FAD-dependent oxidoreductase [Micromonospora endophytica]
MRDPHVSRSVAGQLSPSRRADDLRRLRSERFDVLVIGGGVTGAGAAVDAASRGLKVALVEARDFAAGTSSRSSKLIHGGLRYLEQLEFGLVHEALTERGLLATRLAPHLVRPVPILVPLPGGRGLRDVPARLARRAYYGAGVAAYDVFAGLFGGGRGMPLHRHLSREGTRRVFPSLRADALAGAIRYYDGQVDDARLVVTLARTAASLGAAVVSSARAVGLIRQAREVTGVRVRDLEAPAGSPDAEFEVRARTVIAATGVWTDDMSRMLNDVGLRPGIRVRASKGVHLVVPRSAITGDAGLILRTATSVLFVIPWGGHWIIGTTDTDWRLDRSHPAASASDIDYLLRQVNTVLDRPLTTTDIEGVYAGLRPLLAGEADSTSKLSREHAVIEPMLGLLLVAGGKYTTYRVMAADVVDRAAHRLGGQRQSRTADLPLLGADGYASMWRDRADLARRHAVPVGVVEHLLERYGSLTLDLLALIDADPLLASPLAGAPEYLAAEVTYAARAEGALHLEDVLTRRTRISFETTHRGLESVEHTAELMGAVLGWDDARRAREVTHYRARVEAERQSQLMPDDATADAARLGAPDVRGYAPDRGTDDAGLPR